MAEDISTRQIIIQVKELVKEITEEGAIDATVEDLANKLLVIVTKLTSLNVERFGHVHNEVETTAVSLWNFAVAKRFTSPPLTSLNPKLHHIAFKLIFLSYYQSTDESSLRKQIMMALKTARAWLDCDNSSLAENILNIAADIVGKLKNEMEAMKQSKDGCGDAEREAMKKKDLSLKKDTFRLLSYQAEASFGLGERVKTSEIVSKLNEMLPELPEEATYLTMLTFNFGVDDFQKREYENSVSWLKSSYSFGQSTHISRKIQARTLRLLACAYLDWDSNAYSQKALNTVSLANTEYSHFAGHYLRLRILLESNAMDDTIQPGLDDMLSHPDLSEDLGIGTIKLLAKHRRQDMALSGILSLGKRFAASQDIGSILCTHIEILLASDRKQEVLSVVEDCVSYYKKHTSMDKIPQTELHQVFWDEAAREYEAQNFKKALRWYNFSLNLYPVLEDFNSNRARLHRNRATCCIALQLLDMAYDTIIEAEKCDSTSAFTFYLMYKITLMQGENEKAEDALRKMFKCEGGTMWGSVNGLEGDQGPHLQDLVPLAAHLAMELRNHQVALTAFEGLVQMSNKPQQVLTVTKCLIRLRLNAMDEDKMSGNLTETLLGYLNLAYDRLLQLSEQESAAVGVEEERTWFMKMAWNLAIRCGNAVNMTGKLFHLCSQFNSLGTNTKGLSWMMQQKTCQLMAAAALLQLVKETEDWNEKKTHLEQAVGHIKDCRSSLEMIEQKQISECGIASTDSTTPTLLLLYEFEARSKLGDPCLENLLDQSMGLPNPDPKTFETIAALSMESPNQNMGVSIRALKIAIKMYLQKPRVDYEKCSRAFHSLVELALEKGASQKAVLQEEAWGYYMEAVHVIENAGEGKYPEIEILWLMTKAWNCGINHYSAGRFEEALRTSELAMKLLRYLPTQRSKYEEKMNSIYAVILEKKNGKLSAATLS